MRAFLDALLPSEGLRCGVWIKDKKVQQAFFQTNEDLEQALCRGDAQGWDAYHACSAFNGASRRSESVLSSRALWLDIDSGDGKAFASLDAAIRQCASLTLGKILPEPCFVKSGYGLHAYWFLEEALDPQTWKQYAEGLKRLTPWADQSRTADIASILRTPGTHNYKRGGKVPVVLGPIRGPYELSRFSNLLGHHPGVGKSADLPVRQAPLSARRLGRVAAGIANIYGTDLADADAVADGCRQIGVCRETQGRVSEPIWKAMMGVLAHCHDGEEIAHEWSTGDPRYNEGETQAKYDRAVAFGPPPTCGHFASLNAAGCVGCVFAGRVTTPVQVGRQQVQNNAGATAAGSPVSIRSDAQRVEAVGEVLPMLPPEFTWGSHGELLFPKSGLAGDEPITIAKNPVFLLGAARGEIRRDAVTFVLRHFIPSEGWYDVEMPAATMFGSQGPSVLAGKGILVENAAAFQKFVRDSFNLHIESKKLGVMFEQCGWKENDTAFLSGNKLYRASGVEEISGSPEIAYRAQLIGPRAGGSLDGWKSKVDQLFGVGREASTFAMLAGFAAPLIRFLSTTEGGAVVSVVSRESGQGKSVGIDGATSIWGNGEALRLINFDTQVARAITWGVLGNLPCVLDDIAHKDAEQARDFIQRFTDGRDKMRGTREGEIRHLLANWQTILITSSNHSLVDMITSIGGTTAMAYRILHFEASLPVGVDKKRGEQNRREMLQHWGHAGDAYLRYLLLPEVLAWAKHSVSAVQQQLIESHGYSTEHRFWTRTLACVFVAHAIVHKMGLVSFPVNVISDWAIDQTKSMGDIGVMKHAGVSFAADSAAEVLSTYLSENIDHMLILADRPKDGQYGIMQQPIPRGSIKIRFEQKPERIYISEADFRKYLVKRQFSFAHFKDQMLRLHCWLELRDKRSLTQGTPIRTGPQRLLCFDTAHPDIGGMTQLALVHNVDADTEIRNRSANGT